MVFGSLFSHLTSMEQIPIFINAYQELRRPRCNFLRQAEFDNVWLMSLPAGPEARARDENVRRTNEEWHDGMLKEQYDEFSGIFGYDAGDAAEEWWVSWGRLREEARDRRSKLGPHIPESCIRH